MLVLMWFFICFLVFVSYTLGVKLTQFTALACLLVCVFKPYAYSYYYTRMHMAPSILSQRGVGSMPVSVAPIPVTTRPQRRHGFCTMWSSCDSVSIRSGLPDSTYIYICLCICVHTHTRGPTTVLSRDLLALMPTLSADVPIAYLLGCKIKVAAQAIPIAWLEVAITWLPASPAVTVAKATLVEVMVATFAADPVPRQKRCSLTCGACRRCRFLHGRHGRHGLRLRRRR